ncbi:MAG: hypothetical protein MUE83_09225 [Tabrizicola sp.]|jgi:hypothetical protein|nr:hypothetical protein [Tabrizicola sp.]
MFRFLATLALIAAPAQAEMLPGAEDPAFRAALTTLLAKDDPAAVASLRDLAEAGNTAALVALPFALQWVPPTGNLKEKNAQRMVGGLKAQDAAAAAHEATALWNTGQVLTVDDLADRAAGLLALGEPEKAAVLLSNWVNQTGGRGTLPPQLLSDDTPAMLGAFALSQRLIDAAFNGGPASDDAARLLSLMREDRLVGWLTYVHLLETAPEIFDIIGSPLAGTGLSAGQIDRRLADARAVRSVWFGFARDDVPTPMLDAAFAREVLMGRAELRPAQRLCQAHCPDSLQDCESAVLAYPGQPFGSFEAVQPFASVLDPQEFAASDRGVFALIPLRSDPAAATDRATAESIDACYGALLARRDRLHFGP